MKKKYEVEDILSVSRDLIRKQGYHNTGINDILKTTNIPKGSFYNFFNSKEDFMVELLDFYGKGTLDNMVAVMGDTSKEPLDRIEFFYKMMANYNAEEGCVAGCMVNNTLGEVAGLSLKIANACNKQFDGWMEVIARIIEEGQEKGQINDDYPALELAEFAHQNFFGALSRMKATRSLRPTDISIKMTIDFLSEK